MTQLYQINTRVLLGELTNQLALPSGQTATLDDIPDSLLDQWQQMGMDWIWLLSVWQTGTASRKVSRSQDNWRAEYAAALPDLREDDIQGSGFAIQSYHVHTQLGGSPALLRLREKLHQRNMQLMLDFVPNHMALDHPWAESHPEYFIQGTPEQIAEAPENYFMHPSGRIFAYGKDPNFSGWPDTLQLDYSSPALLQAMQTELSSIAMLADGVRCDMAMLLLPDVFQRTWGRPALPFWPDAISATKSEHPNFTFLAEVYWDREWDLMQLGFDYCYDKRFYDRLMHQSAQEIRMHLIADTSFQNKLARFLENHDEPRVARALPLAKHFAAAVLTYSSPGLKFFHEGQFEGRVTKVSPHLVRRPAEDTNLTIKEFYNNWLNRFPHRYTDEGKWLLLEVRPIWDGNDSCQNIIAYRWKDIENRHLFVIVNYSHKPSQGRIRVIIDRSCVSEVILRDAFTSQNHVFHRGAMLNPGFPVELQPWQYWVVEEVDNF